MQSTGSSHIGIYLVLAWLLLNLIQAASTELIADEAYYWVYAQHLDWGYFDHPPATAFVIWLGSWLPGKEISVRWLFVLMGTGSLYATYLLVRPKDLLLFSALLLSVILVHIGGFLAVPDIPLLFTTSLFFLLYKSYLREDRWLTALGLGLAVAAMAYSKYTTVVVLISALAGAWWLIKRPSFWLIPLLAFVLFLPHLYWQMTHGYPTFQYHLIDRGAEPWSLLFPVNFVLGQFVVWGPFMAFILFPAAWKFRQADRLTQAMRWCTLGIFGFCLLLSLKGRIEANWTAVALGPLIYLAYHYIATRPVWRKWTYRLTIPSLVLIGLFRFYMMVEWIPRDWLPRNEFHGWEDRALAIQGVAKNRPVVFFNNYQQASRYYFYTGQIGHSQSLITYAGDQFDLLHQVEEDLQGGPAVLMDNWAGKDTLHFSRGQSIRYTQSPAYYSFNRLRIEVLEMPTSLPPDSLVSLPVRLSNPTTKSIRIPREIRRQTRIKCFVFQHKKYILSGTAQEQLPFEVINPGEAIDLWFPLRTPDRPGTYRFRYGVEWQRYPGRNGNFTQLVIQ